MQKHTSSHLPLLLAILIMGAGPAAGAGGGSSSLLVVWPGGVRAACLLTQGIFTLHLRGGGVDLDGDSESAANPLPDPDAGFDDEDIRGSRGAAWGGAESSTRKQDPSAAHLQFLPDANSGPSGEPPGSGNQPGARDEQRARSVPTARWLT